MIATDQFILEDLIYVPLGTHHPMYARPYMVNTTESAVNTIADRIQEHRTAKITPTLLGDITNNIIQHSSVGYNTHINTDWVSTRRFIFMLKVKTFDMTGNEINSYIQGYTEYDGITANGTIDTNLMHYINNVIETTSMTYNTPTGVYRTEKLYKIYNVFSTQGNEDLFVQRPTDILEQIEVQNVKNLLDTGSSVNVWSAASVISPFSGKIVGSTAENGISSEYLSKILTTGVLANKSRDIQINSYEVSDQSSVETKVPEPSVNDNRFIKYLSNLAGSRTVQSRFAFGSLMSLDNTIYNRFKLINITKDLVSATINNTPEVGDYWNGQDPVTVKAYSLIEASVSLALKYGFSKIHFSASNMTNPTGAFDVFVSDFNSFINLSDHDFNYLIEIFKNKFITDIFVPETMSGTVPMHMEGYINILGTSKIFLSYAGFPSNWYTIPTVANSSFSSVTTVNNNAFNEMSFNVNNIIESLSSTNSGQKVYY